MASELTLVVSNETAMVVDEKERLVVSPKNKPSRQKAENDGPKKPTRLRDLALPGGTDNLRMSPHAIEIDPLHNPRDFSTPEMQQRIVEMKAMIKEDGVLRALEVRYDAGRCILVDGETRLRSVLALIEEGEEIISVPVTQVPGNDEAGRLFRALIANTGRPLTQLECGKAFQRLKDLGATPELIATKVGQSLRYVLDAIQIHDAPQEVKKLVAENAVSIPAAIAEVKQHGTGSAKTLTEKVKQAKAKGITTPLRREKAAAVNPHRDLLELIAKEVRSEVEEMDQNEVHCDHVGVTIKLIRKVLELTAKSEDSEAA